MVNRRGALELGINSIVILIIALVILGLGIAFVTNLFMTGQNKLGGIIDNTKLSFHADASDQIKLDSDTVTVKDNAKDEARLTVSVYNNIFSSTDAVDLTMSDGCVAEGTGTIYGITVTAPGQIITPGTDAGYLAIIKAATDVTADITYVCTLTASDGSSSGKVSKQFFVKVIK